LAENPKAFTKGFGVCKTLVRFILALEVNRKKKILG